MSSLEELTQIVQELREEVCRLRGESRGASKKKIPCKGVTGKGTPCRNGAIPGADYCRMHGREPKDLEKPKRSKKEPKMKKIQPEHTHDIGEIPTETCALCESHGDVMDPDLPNAEFVSDDITQRLRELLATEPDV